MTPAGKHKVKDMDPREISARRVAQELRDDTLVNLGIGLPTMVAKFVPLGLRVYFQSENGIIGFGARPPEGMEDVHLTDAGGAFARRSRARWRSILRPRSHLSGAGTWT